MWAEENKIPFEVDLFEWNLCKLKIFPLAHYWCSCCIRTVFFSRFDYIGRIKVPRPCTTIKIFYGFWRFLASGVMLNFSLVPSRRGSSLLQKIQCSSLLALFCRLLMQCKIFKLKIPSAATIIVNICMRWCSASEREEGESHFSAEIACQMWCKIKKLETSSPRLIWLVRFAICKSINYLSRGALQSTVQFTPHSNFLYYFWYFILKFTVNSVGEKKKNAKCMKLQSLHIFYVSREYYNENWFFWWK